MKSKLLILLFAIVSVFTLFIYQQIKFNDGKLHIVFCNVGQGDAIFIRTPKGSDILVDGGPDKSVLNCLSSHMPFYDRDLELVFLTHPHADHLTGLIDVLKNYQVTSFNTEAVKSDSTEFKELEKVLKEKNISTRFIYTGDRFKFTDGVVISTLWPEKNSISAQAMHRSQNLDKNSFSLVQDLSYKDFNLLLTGDVQADILDKLLINLNEPDILKIAHHGSKTGTDEFTFTRIKPSLTVISVGKNNRYGHPAASVLNLLQSKNINYLRTDQDGEIEVISEGKGFKIYKN